MLEDPKFPVRVMYDGDRLACGGCDFIILAFKVDGLVIVDPAHCAEGKVEIQQAGRRWWAKMTPVLRQGIFPDILRDPAGAALASAVLAADFHLEDFIGMLPSLNSGVSQESDDAFLESAKSAFDLAFGLGSRSDKVSYAKAKQGALELASRIAMVVGRARAKETQCVSVNSVWQPVDFESGAEVAEVIPCCVGRDETSGNIEAGMVIDGEQKDLFDGGGPPLVDGTVVLIKLSDVCAAEAAAGALFSRDGRDEVGEVRFDMNFNAGSRPLEVAEAEKFVSHELVVGRVLQGQEVLKECPDFFGPNAAMSAAAGFGLAGPSAAQVVAPQLIEAGFADA